MGAVVVDGSVNSSHWNKQKPSDYQGKDLDKAIKAYETLAGKGPTIASSLPTMPKQSIKEFETCIKNLESAVADMKKAVTYFKQMGESLKAVTSAASKTSAELRKLAKDKSGDEKNKYLSAASVAAAIDAGASDIQQKLQ